MAMSFRASGVIAIFFYPIVFIFMNLILLNLFLAILLANFDEKPPEEDAKTISSKGKLGKKLKMFCKSICCNCKKCCCCRHEIPDEKDNELMSPQYVSSSSSDSNSDRDSDSEHSISSYHQEFSMSVKSSNKNDKNSNN